MASSEDSTKPIPAPPPWPVLMMWVRPRQTMRAILDLGPRSPLFSMRPAVLSILLGMSWGLSVFMVPALATGFGPNLHHVMTLAVLVGAVIGVVAMIGGGALIGAMTDWFGEGCQRGEGQAAWGWGYGVLGLPSLLIWAAVYLAETNALSPVGLDLDPVAAAPGGLLVAGVALVYLLALWAGFFVWPQAVAELGRMPYWKGLVSVLIMSAFLMTASAVLTTAFSSFFLLQQIDVLSGPVGVG